jgi:hypothetical protein
LKGRIRNGISKFESSQPSHAVVLSRHIADEIEEEEAGYLIERALDAARSRLFRLLANKD